MKLATNTRAPPGRKAVWIDVGLAAVTGGTASIGDVDIVADEIPSQARSEDGPGRVSDNWRRLGRCCSRRVPRPWRSNRRFPRQQAHLRGGQRRKRMSFLVNCRSKRYNAPHQQAATSVEKDGSVQPSADLNYSVNGYRFNRADLEIMLYPGYAEEEVKILASISDPNAKAEPGFLVDPYGIRTRVTSLWPEARALDGKMLGYPFPGNFHWEAIEWIGLMRAVLEAQEKFRVMELGAGWGPAIVSSSVLARLRGISDIRMTGVEGDPHHHRFMVQHVRDNGFDPDAQRLHQAAVAVEKGIAHWPVTVDSSDNYGFRPIHEDGDYMNRNFAETQEVKLLAMRDLVRSEVRWDLIHMDVQGAEFDICRDAIPALKARAKRVMIGTHSRKVEGSLMALFAEAGWVLENEKPCKFTFWPNHKTLEAMTTVDGTQTWNNPAL